MSALAEERDLEYLADAEERAETGEHVRCLDEDCAHAYRPVQVDGATCEECGGDTEVLV